MKNCQEITEEIEQSKFERLSIKDRLSIRTHLTLCKPCRNYFRDSKSLDKMLIRKFKHLGNYEFNADEIKELKEKLIR